MTALRTSSPLAALLLLGAIAAQSGGPTMALAQGFSVDPLTTLPLFSSASVVLTKTDFDTLKPTPLGPVPGRPDFSALPIPASLDVDALSIGLDWIPNDGTGTIAIPTGNWAAVTWSVRRSTVGAPGSLIAREAANADGAAGDIFCYVFPPSALPAALVGVPFRAQDSTEISIATPGLRANIDAHDLYVGLIYKENPQLAALLPPPTVFFSVTAATMAAIPAVWGPPPLRNGATVFSTTWVPATSSWTAPIVAMTPGSLGLSDLEDLDALAVDLGHGRVVFSTDPALPPPSPLPPRNPLLYSNLGSGTNVTLVMPGGGPVSVVLGLGSGADDIDGVCFVDPGSPGTPSQIRLDRLLGTPGNAVVPTLPTTLQASATRRLDPLTNQEKFVTMMTGWPAPGTPSPGFAITAITIGPPSLGPWISSGFFVRPDPASPYFVFEGHPERHEFAIPPAFSLSNVPVSFVWGSFSASTVALSFPVTIVL
jgi:hypothetical protein